MKKIVLILLFCEFLAGTHLTFSQTSPEAQHRAIVNNYVESYNRQDYRSMRRDFSFLMKLFLSKRTIKATAAYAYAVKGKGRIVSYNSDGRKVRIALVYAKDSTEEQRMSFNIRNGRIRGLAIKGSYLSFAKQAGAPVNAERFSARMDSLMQLKHHAAAFNGCVAVTENGHNVYEGCAGYADLSAKAALNTNTLFELASCSKQFTSMAILILIEQGKLDYTDDIRKFNPGLPYKHITVEHLLTHTSGLPDYEEVLDKYWDKTRFATNADIVATFKEHRPKVHFKPGTKYAYSNTGYAMLSLIIEAASGMSYADFLKTQIFDPLGMKRSRVYNTRRWKNERIDNYAFGYVYSDSLKRYVLPDSLPGYAFVKWLDAITGDGTVNASISDMLLWEQALRENKLVKKASLDRAFTPYRLANGKTTEYGYGWEVQRGEKLETTVSHTGSWPGYITLTLHFVDRDRSITILSNSDYYNIEKFAIKIVGMLNGER